MEKVEITDVAAEGKAIAKVNDLVIFVPYVVPGDVVDLQIKRKKHHYAEAEAVKFHQYSPVRAVPFCQHYGVCGGCKWQVLPYSEQIRYKQKQVTDNLTRIGKVELPEISPILGSAKTEFYRNKLEFTFSNKRWLTAEEVRQNVVYEQMNAVGFHIPNAFDKVLAIEKCWLQDDISNRIRNAVRDYAYEHNYPFINLRTHEGMLRNMIVRTSTTGELMVILICKIEKDEEMELFKQLLQYVADGNHRQLRVRTSAPGHRHRICARSHRGRQGQLGNQRHQEHAVLCRRHEGHADAGLYQRVRTSGCNHHRPSSCGYAPGCSGCYPVCRAETHCVCKLQSRHAGKGLTAARCQIPGEGRPAGGHVPAYASCGKRGAA